MSRATWFYEKARDCGRLAKAATDALTRAAHLRDQENWNDIAVRIDADDQAEKKSVLE